MTKPATAGNFQILDPRTLGRPVHLLGGFTEQIRGDLTALLRDRLNRRYQASFEIVAITLSAAAAAHAAVRWMPYTSAAGRMGFAIDRSLLLCILGYRYGVPDLRVVSTENEPSQPRAEETKVWAERETTTEERLAQMLGRALVTTVGQRVQALGRQNDDMPQPLPAAPLFKETTASVPVQGGWVLEARVVERARKADGSLRILLDEPWSTSLLQGLAPMSKRTAQPAGAKPGGAQSVGAQLQVTLTARLLEKQLTVGTLLDMSPGDVIPISLGASDVLIGDSRLFRAAVAEHQGKLWLTSFESVE
jgi:flagellar motor switch protein FliM